MTTPPSSPTHSNPDPIFGPALYPIPTFRGRVSSQLQSEFRDTLKGSHTGLRLFFTTCEPEKTDLGANPKELGPRELWNP